MDCTDISPPMQREAVTWLHNRPLICLSKKGVGYNFVFSLQYCLLLLYPKLKVQPNTVHESAELVIRTPPSERMLLPYMGDTYYISWNYFPVPISTCKVKYLQLARRDIWDGLDEDAYEMDLCTLKLLWVHAWSEKIWRVSSRSGRKASGGLNCIVIGESLIRHTR
jgi:hypothetical protein